MSMGLVWVSELFSGAKYGFYLEFLELRQKAKDEE